MKPNYLQRVEAQTPTRFWINNPTRDELDRAVAAGALSGTTNPAYGSVLLKREPDYIHAAIDEVIRRVEDDNEAADQVYQKISACFMEAFLPAFKDSGGKRGFVTMQDDPRRDHRSELIVQYALRHAKVGANYMAKVPVIRTGLEALAELVERNIPSCATECFSMAQAIEMCEIYEKISRKSGKTPPFYITHITGIYDEELQDQVKRNRIDIATEILNQAGCIVGRKLYHTLKARGYHTTLLGGGVRGMQHFTEFVGGDLHVTMNWSTVEDLIRADLPVVSKIDGEASREIVDELCAKIPDFKRAYRDDGLKVDEFEHFAPLLRFRRNFVDGCNHVLKAIAERRSDQRPQPAQKQVKK